MTVLLYWCAHADSRMGLSIVTFICSTNIHTNIHTYTHTYLHRMCICTVISGCEQRQIHTSTCPLSDQNLYGIILLYLSSASTRDRPETCGSPEQANNFAYHSTILFKLFRPRAGLVEVLRSRAQILDILLRNSFACGNLTLLASHFQLFHWRLSDPWKLAARQLPGWHAPSPDLTNTADNAMGLYVLPQQPTA